MSQMMLRIVRTIRFSHRMPERAPFERSNALSAVSVATPRLVRP